MSDRHCVFMKSRIENDLKEQERQPMTSPQAIIRKILQVSDLNDKFIITFTEQPLEGNYKLDNGYMDDQNYYTVNFLRKHNIVQYDY